MIRKYKELRSLASQRRECLRTLKVLKIVFERMLESQRFIWCYHDHYERPTWSVWHKGRNSDNSVSIVWENGKLRTKYSSAAQIQLAKDAINEQETKI